uniref:Uncharacterized protein n=1 Tax=Ochrobactrum phage ORM_20 TaxID=2985243 RepID=A0A9N6ZGE9_9VIRU|nr:hypothetical protein ORM20_00050 [Ochrobactrum phage ORM_20]
MKLWLIRKYRSIKWVKLFWNCFAGVLFFCLLTLGFLAIREDAKDLPRRAANRLCQMDGGIMATHDPDRSRFICWNSNQEIFKTYNEDFIEKFEKASR